MRQLRFGAEPMSDSDTPRNSDDKPSDSEVSTIASEAPSWFKRANFFWASTNRQRAWIVVGSFSVGLAGMIASTFGPELLRSVSGLQPAPRYVVRLDIKGEGQIEGDPRSATCSRACMPQLSGTVSLSAEPAPGSKFVEWRGACRGSENPCLVEVDQELQVEAVFEALPRFDVRLDDGARTSESRPAVAAAVPPQPTPAFSPTRAKSGCKLNVKTRDSGNQRLAYRRCECPGVPAMYSRIGLRIEKNLEDQRELLARTQGLELPEGWRCER